MTSRQPKRKRGVVLTPTGRQKLQEAIKAWEEEDNLGEKLTIEELSDRTKLDAGTVAKVLDCEEGVDRRTLERFFQAFGLTLSEKDYSRPTPSVNKRPVKEIRIDWGEAVDASIFYGRTSELETLEKWIVSDRCRLVALLGMGGIGKTSLAAKLGEKVQYEFDYVVWRSLREAPPLKEILTSLIQFLSNQQETEADLPDSLGSKITKLLEYLRIKRCLVILDNAESILQEGQAGVYREGYEGYGELLRRVGESSHQSCLLVTSREKPRELSAMEGEAFLVRSLQLRGIGGAEGQKVLKAKGLDLSETSEGAELVHRCAGNPLALKLVATTIQDLFDGDISEFLNQETIAFEGVRDLLDQHFDRLSALEKSIMYWLAINREPVSVQELQEDIVPSLTKTKLLEALKGLVGRSLVEKSYSNFTHQPVVMEYVTEKLVNQFFLEIRNKEIQLLNSHALIKATSKDYVRNVQLRLILHQTLNLLNSNFSSKSVLENNLGEILNKRGCVPTELGYLAGNILNLLIQQKVNLSDFSFTNTSIRQAYLQGVDIHGVDFSHSTFTNSSFTQTFGKLISVAFSPESNLIAIGETNGTIWLWKLEDNQPILVLRGHTDGIRSLTFNYNGQIIASGSLDKTIKIWDVASGQCIRTFHEHTAVVWSVAFSPDNKVLASSSADRTIKLWQLDTGMCINTIWGHNSIVYSVTFSPNSQILASGANDKTIKLWSVKTGECIHTLIGHDSAVRSVTFSPDGQVFASGSEDKTIRLWQTSTWQCLNVLLGHTRFVRSLDFSPDGDTLASSSNDQTVRIWDISTGEQLKIFEGHTTWVLSVNFSLDGKFLASCCHDQSVRLWQAETGQCFRTIQGYSNSILSLTFSPDGSTLASGSIDKKIRLWRTKSGECIKLIEAGNSWIYSLAFSPDGKLLASTSLEPIIRLWEINTGRCISVLQGHTDSVLVVDFNLDGTRLISTDRDQITRIWCVKTWQCLEVIENNQQSSQEQLIALNDQQSSVSQEQLIALDEGRITIKSWRTELHGRFYAIKKVQDGNEEFCQAALSVDNQNVAIGSDDGTIRLWDLETGYCSQTLHIPKPYEKMNITGVRGLTDAQRASLIALGAVELE